MSHTKYDLGFTKDGQPFHKPMDWQAWALDMCSLLDRIEAVADQEEVRELCAGRFDIAREHGIEVQIVGKISGLDH